MERSEVGQQGEVKIYRISAMPEMPEANGEVERDKAGRPILSHSEKGHHHVLDGAVDVLERTNDVPPGMRIIYAIVKEPGAALIQTAAEAHGKIELSPGIYEFRRGREFNPFTDEARKIAD